MTKEVKWYTLQGMDNVYDNYGKAASVASKMMIKDGNQCPVPFSTKDDAEAFRKGIWDSYLNEHYKHYQTDADAVIYADGSVNTDKEHPIGGYGVIIFFKSGEIICESAALEDKENGKLISRRYDIDGNLKEEKLLEYPVISGAKEGFVKSGNNEAAEPESARRGLELCFYERDAKKVVLVYDSETIKQRYNLGTAGEQQHPAIFYGELCEKIKKEFGKNAVQFIKVDSHRGKPKGNKPAKPAYRIEEEEFVHAVFNDLADAIAKAETCIGEVSRSENVNLLRAIPERNFKIETNEKVKCENNRAGIRELLKLVLQKEWLRPEFID